MLSHQVSGPRSVKTLFVITALVVLLAPAAKSQTTWTITVNATATGQHPKPDYSIDARGSNPCHYTKPSDPRKLKVCANDIVYWKVTASGSTPKYEMFVYIEEPILLKGGTPTQFFDISDTSPQDGGTVTSDPVQVKTHEYYVAVYDKNSGRLYVEDPRIIIGTGGPNAKAKKKSK